MPDYLTDSQEVELKKYAMMYIPFLESSNCTDRGLAESCVDEIYDFHKLPSPKKVWVPSPRECLISAMSLYSCGHKNSKEVIDRLYLCNAVNNFRLSNPKYEGVGYLYCCLGGQASELSRGRWPSAVNSSSYNSSYFSCLMGPNDLTWGIIIKYLEEVCSEDFSNYPLYKSYLNLVLSGCDFSCYFDDIVVLSESPIEMHCDDWYFPHNASGPAIKYSDGYEEWMYFGERVCKEFIEDPSSIKISDVFSSPCNPLALYYLYGYDNVMRDANIPVIDRDPDFGTLYNTSGDLKFSLYSGCFCSPTIPKSDYNMLMLKSFGNITPVFIPKVIKTVSEAVSYAVSFKTNSSAVLWPGKKSPRLWGGSLERS